MVLDVKDMATLIGGLVGLIGLLKGVYEFSKQNAIKRAENYLKLREKFKESTRFKDLFEMLENDDPQLKRVPYERKQDFLGFYEDIALFVNSGLLKPEVAHYMFSYHALKCAESKNFWNHEHIPYDSPYWSLFKNFVERMKKADELLKKNPSRVSRYRI
jgi:hypothetical protein